VFSGVEFNMNFARVATGVFASLLAIAAPAYLPAQYMRSIQQRWDASDLVCVGHAASPARTGRIQQIDGSDRDELATQVIIDRCLKGRLSAIAEIRVLGFDVAALKNISGGYGYSGPPTGFVSEGRNLLFLKPTKDPDQYEVTVPIFATAIHLADTEPDLPSGEGSQTVRAIVVRELEGALIQFGSSDLSYIDYLMGYLGAQEGIAECLRLSSRVSVPLQRDLAVAMLLKGQSSLEPVVISLLLDIRQHPYGSGRTRQVPLGNTVQERHWYLSKRLHLIPVPQTGRSLYNSGQRSLSAKSKCGSCSHKISLVSGPLFRTTKG